jgi:hypothetical protein
MILSVGIAPSLPGESYALLPDAVKNTSPIHPSADFDLKTTIEPHFHIFDHGEICQRIGGQHQEICFIALDLADIAVGKNGFPLRLKELVAGSK